MKIAIVGYGKMGHIIEKKALERGHTIGCIIDKDNVSDFDSPEFRKCDVAIEFSRPDAAAGNVLKCFGAGVPVVCGTTGWNERIPEMKELCDKGKGTLLQASNFSVGVNMFMALNRYLADMMNAFPQYAPHMVETHHIHKLDHPSGTAVTLAEGIIEKTARIRAWAEPEDGKTLPEDTLPIDHIRSGEVPGIHTVIWDSPQDSISITHSAKSRDGFAVGAVIAAEWLAGKSGFHTIGEMYAEILPKGK